MCPVLRWPREMENKELVLTVWNPRPSFSKHSLSPSYVPRMEATQALLLSSGTPASALQQPAAWELWILPLSAR